MFYRTQNVPQIEGAANVGCEWTASAWNLQPQDDVQQRI